MDLTVPCIIPYGDTYFLDMASNRNAQNSNSVSKLETGVKTIIQQISLFRPCGVCCSIHFTRQLVVAPQTMSTSTDGRLALGTPTLNCSSSAVTDSVHVSCNGLYKTA